MDEKPEEQQSRANFTPSQLREHLEQMLNIAIQEWLNKKALADSIPPTQQSLIHKNAIIAYSKAWSLARTLGLLKQG